MHHLVNSPFAKDTHPLDKINLPTTGKAAHFLISDIPQDGLSAKGARFRDIYHSLTSDHYYSLIGLRAFLILQSVFLLDLCDDLERPIVIGL